MSVHEYPQTVFVPGRINLIGEHIDYHNLAVLPMAIQRGITVFFRKRSDHRVAVRSSLTEIACEFEWVGALEPGESGDWCNYVKAAAAAVAGRWGVLDGIDATVTADLPPAAGLSSSSALLTAITLALLQANGVATSFEDLMDVLPEGEYFVGTRGGGMDHAAVLASRAGSALLVEFAPVKATPVRIPDGWSFLIAHSGSMAEKSNALRAEFNARRSAGAAALRKAGFASFAEARLVDADLPDEEKRAFRHVVTERDRVRAAVQAMENGDASRFGELLLASHSSLRNDLRVSTPALDQVVETATQAGALGARLTGAGFGGCAIVFCMCADAPRVRASLEEYDVIEAIPSPGALFV